MANTLVGDSRVRSGSLRLEDPAAPGGWLDVSCVPSAVAVSPGAEGGTAATDGLEVLCGSSWPGEAAGSGKNTASLDVTLVSDFLEQGLVRWSWMNSGETRKFEWTPSSAHPDSTWKGTIKVAPITVGGDVGARLQPSISFECLSLVLPVAYGGGTWIGQVPTALTAPTSPALEWTYVPSGADAPGTLAALKADAAIGDAGTAKPIRDFTAGEYASLSTGAKVHYKATGGWATGAA